jgi:hypothetical protein
VFWRSVRVRAASCPQCRIIGKVRGQSGSRDGQAAEKPRARLVDAFMGEAVAARPIRAVRAGLAFGVVDTFLVRAAHDAVGHDHRASLMLAKEDQDLLADDRIAAYIDVFGEPAFELVGRVAFVGDDGNCNLGGQVRSRAIEGNRRDRVAPESAPSTLRQPGSRPFSDLLHVLMKYLELRVSVKGQARFAVFYGHPWLSNPLRGGVRDVAGLRALDGLYTRWAG